MTHTFRIPTVEYGYIDFNFEGTGDEAVKEYVRLQQLIQKTLKDNF